MNISLISDDSVKRYDFVPFENEFISVEPDGRFIKISVMREFSTLLSWEVCHPFHPCRRDVPISKGWNISIEIPNKDEIKIIFSKKEETHTLTIACNNSRVYPKPIEIKWD